LLTLFVFIIYTLLLIGWGYLVMTLNSDLITGLLIGAITIEMYYWRVTKQISPNIND